MADVTISELTRGIPSGSNLLPYSTGTSTLGTPVSAIFQNTNSRICINQGATGISNAPGLQINNGSIEINNPGGNQVAISDGQQRWDLDVDTGSAHTLRVRNMIVNTTSLAITTAGYVTTPYQPGFKATITTQSQSTNQIVVWDTVEYATPAGSFNTSTGEWTVPQSGRYLVIVNLLSLRNTTTGDWYVDIKINGSTPVGGRLYTSKAGSAYVHAQLNASGIYRLNAGDKLATLLTSMVGDVNPTVLHNLFCAELLG
jgi:hypothetical protein